MIPFSKQSDGESVIRKVNNLQHAFQRSYVFIPSDCVRHIQSGSAKVVKSSHAKSARADSFPA